MNIDIVKASALAGSGRVDSWYHLSPGARASRRLVAAQDQGLKLVSLGGAHGIASVWAPKRFKRCYAAPLERGVPYLRPYDVFDFLPRPADQLSEPRTQRLDTYRLTRGMILQTCSGRNLGPAVMVDAYLERFVLSHDMVRIVIEDEAMRHYVLAFLKSPTGQELLRRDKSGSVVDHISEGHVASMKLPVAPAKERSRIQRSMDRAFQLRETARLKLDSLRTQYEAALPSPRRATRLKTGWTLQRTGLTNRLDAAFYDPQVTEIRRKLVDRGGRPVGSVAKVLKPPGRYKTRYVAEEYGRPMLSGRQLLQAIPIKLKYLSPSALANVGAYELCTGWIAYPADGRAEEALGRPVFITSDRNGWLASGHVGRLDAKHGVDPGWLYLATSVWQVQVQIKASASGSVVDSTFVQDMEEVVLPPVIELDWAEVSSAWELFAEAAAAEGQATEEIEGVLRQCSSQRP